MVRRRIVATALAQIEAGRAARAALGNDAAAWQRYAAELRRRLEASLASTGFSAQGGPVRARVVARRVLADYTLENVLFRSEPGGWVNANVWIPNARRWAPPWRVIVTPVGHSTKSNQCHHFPAQVFAANGFLAVSFDAPGFGEKATGNNHFEDGVRLYLGGHNPLAFFLADACRAIDYAASRTDTDVSHGVAMTGVSGGGFTTISCAVVDERVRILGPSCFGMPDEDHPVRNGYAACPETLWAGRFADGLALTELIVATGFKPALLMAGKHDSVMTEPIMRRLGREAGAAYAAAGGPEKLRMLVDDCGHDYSVAQAEAFVKWSRRWWGLRAEPVRKIAGGPRKFSAEELGCRPPRGPTMATFAAAEAKRGVAPKSAAVAKERLRELTGVTAKLPALQVVRGDTAKLWTHELMEVSLRDGADWEVPATRLRPQLAKGPATALVWFDPRGRWMALHQWGWLNRAVGFFAAGKSSLSVLTADLPGWGDTAPTPSPFDVVGWGGVDRWTGYVSAATGDSVMAMRVREACRVLRHVRAELGVPARRVFVGGHGLGANVAALAGWLEGPVAGLVLHEPLASFAELAVAPKSVWPHDAYFPGILRVGDLADVLRWAKVPAVVAGARGAAGVASKFGPTGRAVQVEKSADAEVLVRWLAKRGGAK